MIDNIERNFAQAAEYVAQAKNETKQAVVYQKKARRVRISFLKQYSSNKRSSFGFLVLLTY